MARQGCTAEDILIGTYTPDPGVVGLTLGELAARSGVSPGEAVIGLAARGEAAIVRFAMSEDDIETLMRHPAVCFGTDGFGLADYGPLSQGRQHPRSFGTFARVLGTFVRERPLRNGRLTRACHVRIRANLYSNPIARMAALMGSM